jgi:hypothetical protein
MPKYSMTAMAFILAFAGAAYAAEPKPHASGAKSEETTTSTMTDTKTSETKDMAKHKCPDGESWQNTCVKHDAKGEKCIKKSGWSCKPSLDEPMPIGPKEQ